MGACLRGYSGLGEADSCKCRPASTAFVPEHQQLSVIRPVTAGHQDSQAE